MNIKNKLNHNILLWTISIGLVLSSCSETEGYGHSHGANEHEESDHGHDHAQSELTNTYTYWSERSELFVEFGPLIVGEVTQFAAHFTDLKDFKSVNEGTVTVSLIKGQKGIRHKVEQPSSPGIFTPALKPLKEGMYSLQFEIVTPTFEDKIVIEKVPVFSTLEEANADEMISQEEGDITFLKEQAWKIDFANVPVKRDTFYESINVGGQILPAQGDEKTIVASTNGIVLLTNFNTFIGSEVKQGQRLFTITGGDIAINNIQTEFLKAKSKYENTKTVFERKKQLYENKAISKAEYEKAKLAFEIAKSEYQSLSSNFASSGKVIKSNTNGFLKTLFKSQGEYVQTGDPLAVISENKNLTIQADVSQTDFQKLDRQLTANFSFNDQVYSIEDFNGKLLSFAKSVSSQKPKIPIYFEIQNKGKLLPGSFIEVWIKTKPKSGVLIIPKSALLENAGTYSVIVQKTGESFENRPIQIAGSDGRFVHVVNGLTEGERVVTRGNYQVKMASMSGQVPGHGHSH